MKKKLLAVVALTVAAITLVVATVLATIAYMSASSAVSNTFTVGNIMIEMFESRVDENGQKLAGLNGVKDADGNSYHLVNGKSYDKDPTIYVAPNSDSSYIFIKVRNQIFDIEDGNVLKQGENGENDAPTMREQLIENGWVKLYETDTHDIIYCYSGKVDSSVVIPDGQIAVSVKNTHATDKLPIDLFQEFTVDPNVSLSQYGGAKVTITAFAIQDHFETSVIKDVKGSQAYMMRVWNILQGEFSFEYVTIPEDDIAAAPGYVDPNTVTESVAVEENITTDETDK